MGQPPVSDFQVGQAYNRRRDIHDIFGGQQRGGITTPAGAPLIFLFTGESGEQHGYSDGWDPTGVFFYTGEGQVGPMRFVRGNRAIRDHAADGKSLLLFEALNKSGEYRFIGPFTCANWENGSGRDRKGAIRETIIFHLIPDAASSAPALAPPANSTSSIEALRKRAYAAAVATSGSAGKEAKRIYYERSAAVRDYVLSRAAGTCECCKMPAPFTRKDGTLYLEPHHIRRVSDGGPDHPRWVGAICPACHREIHFGQNGQVKNDSLMRYLASIEETPL